MWDKQNGELRTAVDVLKYNDLVPCCALVPGHGLDESRKNLRVYLRIEWRDWWSEAWATSIIHFPPTIPSQTLHWLTAQHTSRWNQTRPLKWEICKLAVNCLSPGISACMSWLALLQLSIRRGSSLPCPARTLRMVGSTWGAGGGGGVLRCPQVEDAHLRAKQE